MFSFNSEMRVLVRFSNKIKQLLHQIEIGLPSFIDVSFTVFSLSVSLILCVGFFSWLLNRFYVKFANIGVDITLLFISKITQKLNFIYLFDN